MHDIVIIGGGPVGMYGAAYAQRLGMEVLLMEAAPQLGGQPALLYGEKYIYDLPAILRISAREFVARLEGTIPEGIQVVTGEYVLGISEAADGFAISTQTNEYMAKNVLITTGNGIFAPRKLILDKDQYDNIHYHIARLQDFQGKRVAIFGGGDSAIDWALMLEHIAASVVVIHRREAFRAHESSIKKLKDSGVSVKVPYLLEDLKGSNHNVSQIDLVKVGDSLDKVSLSVDEVIVLYGFSPSAGPQKEWGLDLYRHDIRVNTHQETSRKGIYAAGDACYYEGKVKMIVTGLMEVIRAIEHLARGPHTEPQSPPSV